VSSLPPRSHSRSGGSLRGVSGNDHLGPPPPAGTRSSSRHYLVFARGPWDNGILSHKFMELLYMGIDASCTHMYERGLAISSPGSPQSRRVAGPRSWTCCGLFGSPGPALDERRPWRSAHGVAPSGMKRERVQHGNRRNVALAAPAVGGPVR